MKRQLDEQIAYILGGKDEAEQIARTKETSQADAAFLVLMRMGVDPAMKIQGLPEGSPDTYEPDIHSPDGISDTTARQELRRIKSFLPNGAYASLKPTKRENVWIQILEGVHWREAQILTAIKDQTLLEIYPTLRPVFEALGLVARINKSVEIAEPPCVETVTESPVETTLAPAKKGRKTNA